MNTHKKIKWHYYNFRELLNIISFQKHGQRQQMNQQDEDSNNSIVKIKYI